MYLIYLSCIKEAYCFHYEYHLVSYYMDPDILNTVPPTPPIDQSQLPISIDSNPAITKTAVEVTDNIVVEKTTEKAVEVSQSNDTNINTSHYSYTPLNNECIFSRKVEKSNNKLKLESNVQYKSDVIRGMHGSDYDHLKVELNSMPGDPAPSVEGWVVIIYGIPPEYIDEDALWDVCMAQDFTPDVVLLAKSSKSCKPVGHALVKCTTKSQAELLISATNNKLISDLFPDYKVATDSLLYSDFAFTCPQTHLVATKKDLIKQRQQRKKDRN